MPANSPDRASVIAKVTPDGLPVVADARQFAANSSIVASASVIDAGGRGWPRRSCGTE